jgi:hypothetical protein
VDEGIVEGSEYMGDTEYEFTFSNLRTKTGNLFLGSNLLLWRLFHSISINYKGSVNSPVIARGQEGAVP